MPLPVTNYKSLPVLGDPLFSGIDNAFKEQLAQRISQEQLRQSQIQNQYLPRDYESKITGQELLNRQNVINNEFLPRKNEADISGQELLNQQNVINNEYLPREKQLSLREKLANAVHAEIDNRTREQKNRQDLALNPLKVQAALGKNKAIYGNMTPEEKEAWYWMHSNPESKSEFEAAHPEFVAKFWDPNNLALSPGQQMALQQMASQKSGQANKEMGLRQGEAVVTPASVMQRLPGGMKAPVQMQQPAAPVEEDPLESFKKKVEAWSPETTRRVLSNMITANKNATTEQQRNQLANSRVLQEWIGEQEGEMTEMADLASKYVGSGGKAKLLADKLAVDRGYATPEQKEGIAASIYFPNVIVETLGQLTQRLEGMSIAVRSKDDIKGTIDAAYHVLGSSPELAYTYAMKALERIKSLENLRIKEGNPIYTQEEQDIVRAHLTGKKAVKKGTAGGVGVSPQNSNKAAASSGSFF